MQPQVVRSVAFLVTPASRAAYSRAVRRGLLSPADSSGPSSRAGRRKRRGSAATEFGNFSAVLSRPDRCRHAGLACNRGADTTVLEWRNRPVCSRCGRRAVNMGVSGPSGGRRASDSTPSHHRSHACGKLVWAIARRGDNRGRNYPRPDQDTMAEPRTVIIKHLGLQSPACSGHLCNTFSGIFHNIGGYLGLYCLLRLGWTWPGDGSAARERRRPRCC